MLDIFAEYATDEALENEGTWVPFGSASLRIGRTGNRKYVKLLTAAVEANKMVLDQKTPEAEALSDKIMIDTLAEAVLFDWKLLAYKKEPLPYTKDNARLLLGHKDFRREVVKLADDMGRFCANMEAEQEKN